MSAVEAIINVLVGYAVAVAATILVLPLFGLHASTRDAFGISAAFTIISVTRSYILRRMFNRLSGRG